MEWVKTLPLILELFGKLPLANVNKTSNEKKYYIQTNTYTFKLFLNVATAGIEASVVSGNTFLCSCVKEDCRLRAQPSFDTFHQSIVIAEAL
jgi:hypothetical protein